MVRYVKCPRCELNYIDGETQEYCDVCIAEIKGNKLQFADLEDEDFVDVLGDDKIDVCPVCGVNSISYGESMCESCKVASQYDVEEDIDIEKDEEWKNYLDDETEDLTVDDAALEEELREEFGDEEEESFEDETYEDDFDEDDFDLDDYDEGDFDDDDFDDDDDDDF